MANVAFIGLGVMGGPMAGHLAKAGHSVTVYNRTTDRAAAWVTANGGKSQPTPARGGDRRGDRLRRLRLRRQR